MRGDLVYLDDVAVFAVKLCLGQAGPFCFGSSHDAAHSLERVGQGGKLEWNSS